jgi:hypothetical protein
MNKESRSNTVLIVVLVMVSCLVLLCVAIAVLIFLFGVSPFTVEETPIETTILTAAQLEQCRELLAIQSDVKIEGEYYLYTPGFLDDSMECHLQAHANSLEDIFDLTIVDPSQTTAQEIAPGRFLRLTIDNPEAGLFIIEGFWFET